jgi:hypothetical protein
MDCFWPLGPIVDSKLTFDRFVSTPGPWSKPLPPPSAQGPRLEWVIFVVFNDFEATGGLL